MEMAIGMKLENYKMKALNLLQIPFTAHNYKLLSHAVDTSLAEVVFFFWDMAMLRRMEIIVSFFLHKANFENVPFRLSDCSSTKHSGILGHFGRGQMQNLGLSGRDVERANRIAPSLLLIASST
ncbi:peptidyl-prolyl cis-trans isomerase Pin1 [Sesbania bispinosa]|nr:peptidyl-prolyl cis-trans isomerase Pin1 [Sesbania bispinosa]